MCKYTVRSTARKRMGPKQNTKEHWETIYCNIILARLILKRYIGVKGVKANASKGNTSYSLVNAIGGNNPRALRRPNKGKKHNNNFFKDRNNRSKRLALLSRCLSK